MEVEWESEPDATLAVIDAFTRSCWHTIDGSWSGPKLPKAA
jgi:hypothetical protein